MTLANQEAQRFNHEYIGTEHILLAIIVEGRGVAAQILQRLRIDADAVRREAEKLVQSGPDMVALGRLPQTPRAKQAMRFAIEESGKLGHNFIGTEHLLLGLIRERGGVAAEVLAKFGLNLDDLARDVVSVLRPAVDNQGNAAPWARLVGRGWLRRAIEVALPGGPYLVEYNGRGMGYESVMVDGVETRKSSRKWFVPRFEFRLGACAADLEVHVWPWLAVRSLVLRIEDRIVYAEGEGRFPDRWAVLGGEGAAPPVS